MFPELIYIRHAITTLRRRLKSTRRNEYGYSTEAVLITALLALLAIGALGIIATKVLAKANDIKTQ